jgi:hypothetical protein
MRTKRCLHSHEGPVSPISSENEVTNFNEEQGSLDANDNWQVKLMDGANEWLMSSTVTLFHTSSNSELVSRLHGQDHPRYNYTMGHQEVRILYMFFPDDFHFLVLRICRDTRRMHACSRGC